MDVTLDSYMENALKRIYARVDKNAPGGCWQWTATVNSNGYGSMSFRGERMRLVHRLLYQFIKGVDLTSKQLCLHHCDNRRCVNPDHIFIGDDAANHADMVRKGRNPKGEQGKRNKLVEAQVLEILRDYRRGRRGRSPWSNARDLAVKYGVDVTAIHGIVSGRKWRHIPRSSPLGGSDAT